MNSLVADGTKFREKMLTPDARTAVISSTRIGARWDIDVAEITAHTVALPLAPLRSSYHSMLAAVGTGTLAVLRANEGWNTGDIQRFLRLSFPSEGMAGVGRSVAFDDVYGIALAFARGRLFVMQY
jgi:hypothetical protein